MTEHPIHGTGGILVRIAHKLLRRELDCLLDVVEHQLVDGLGPQNDGQIISLSLLDVSHPVLEHQRVDRTKLTNLRIGKLSQHGLAHVIIVGRSDHEQFLLGEMGDLGDRDDDGFQQIPCDFLTKEHRHHILFRRGQVFVRHIDGIDGIRWETEPFHRFDVRAVGGRILQFDHRALALCVYLCDLRGDLFVPIGDDISQVKHLIVVGGIQRLCPLLNLFNDLFHNGIQTLRQLTRQAVQGIERFLLVAIPLEQCVGQGNHSGGSIAHGVVHLCTGRLDEI